MAQTKVEWTGLDVYLKLLAKGGEVALKALTVGLVNEANAAFRQSQREVPVKTGVLRSSGNVLPPSVVNNEVFVEVVYGGAAKKYAKIQHDTPTFRHPRGGKAFYLRDPVEARRPGLERRLAVVIEAQIRGLM